MAQGNREDRHATAVTTRNIRLALQGAGGDLVRVRGKGRIPNVVTWKIIWPDGRERVCRTDDVYVEWFAGSIPGEIGK